MISPTNTPPVSFQFYPPKLATNPLLSIKMKIAIVTSITGIKRLANTGHHPILSFSRERNYPRLYDWLLHVMNFSISSLLNDQISSPSCGQNSSITALLLSISSHHNTSSLHFPIPLLLGCVHFPVLHKSSITTASPRPWNERGHEKQRNNNFSCQKIPLYAMMVCHSRSLLYSLQCITTKSFYSFASSPPHLIKHPHSLLASRAVHKLSSFVAVSYLSLILSGFQLWQMTQDFVVLLFFTRMWFLGLLSLNSLHIGPWCRWQIQAQNRSLQQSFFELWSALSNHPLLRRLLERTFQRSKLPTNNKLRRPLENEGEMKLSVCQQSV